MRVNNQPIINITTYNPNSPLRTRHMQRRVARARVARVGVGPVREERGHGLLRVQADEAMQGGIALLHACVW